MLWGVEEVYIPISCLSTARKLPRRAKWQRRGLNTVSLSSCVNLAAGPFVLQPPAAFSPPALPIAQTIALLVQAKTRDSARR